MDLFLCSRDSSGNSYHTMNSSLRLREEVAKSCCLFSCMAFCLEICFATICKKYRALLGGGIRIFCLYSRKKKEKKASQKMKSKCVCIYEHNFIISIFWGFSEQEAAHCPFTKHTYGDFMVGFVLKIMICLCVAVVYVSVYISFLTPVLFSKVSAVKFLHETIDTFSTRCSEGKKAP